MIVVEENEFKNNMNYYSDKVLDDMEIVTITRKKENMVVMPQAIYDKMQKKLRDFKDS